MPTGSREVNAKWHVVVVALADLGGASRVVDTEDVAVRAHEVAPSSFSWRKYPDQINADGVRVALTDARKAKNGRLVDGSVKTGWSLTPAGVEWIEQHGDTVRASINSAPPQTRDDQRSETRKRGVERARVQRLPAWKRWSHAQDVPIREAEEVFRIDRYTESRTRSLQVMRLVELLREDATVGRFLDEMAELVRATEGKQ